MARRYLRNPKADQREIDDAVFLVNPDNEAIYHLNATGAALWRLLAEPTSAQEAATVLHEAFPEVGKEQIENDVGKIIGDFEKNGLVRDCE